MSCCDEPINLGCFDYCSSIDLGYDAVQNGDHKILVYLVNSTVQEIDLAGMVITDPFVIPASTLNEAKQQDIQIEQPDGTLYEFVVGTTCVRLNTEVRV